MTLDWTGQSTVRTVEAMVTNRCPLLNYGVATSKRRGAAVASATATATLSLMTDRFQDMRSNHFVSITISVAPSPFRRKRTGYLLRGAEMPGGKSLQRVAAVAGAIWETRTR